MGYDWSLPYIPGESKATVITTEISIDIASYKGIPIKYNEISQAPYFFYTQNDDTLHIVWFKDARSINAIMGLINDYELKGTSIWNIMYYFPQMWFVINTQYEIDRITDLTPIS